MWCQWLHTCKLIAGESLTVKNLLFYISFGHCRCFYCVPMAGIQTWHILNTSWFLNHKHFVFVLEDVSLYILFAPKSACCKKLSVKNNKLIWIQVTIIRHWSGTYSRCREQSKTRYLPIPRQEKSTKYNGLPHNQIGLPYVIITVSKYYEYDAIIRTLLFINENLPEKARLCEFCSINYRSMKKEPLMETM